MLKILLVEDNDALRRAMKTGLEATGQVHVIGEADSGEDALTFCAKTSEVSENLGGLPDVILMDVHLTGEMNGIQAAVAIRRELPRLPVVFYSIQDDDAYYRDFLRSGILSHYAYVRKSNYLLPASIVPLLKDAAAGRSFIDPEIEARVQEVRHKDAYDPLALLEPNEREVIALLAHGLTNEQIAERLGFHDKRAVSRTNGQIYAAWRLNETATDEKVARTRASLIYHRRQLVMWDEDGTPRVMNPQGEWISLSELDAG
jgi:DNA-binding NarL/FixJ family response regulator